MRFRGLAIACREGNFFSNARPMYPLREAASGDSAMRSADIGHQGQIAWRRIRHTPVASLALGRQRMLNSVLCLASVLGAILGPGKLSIAGVAICASSACGKLPFAHGFRGASAMVVQGFVRGRPAPIKHSMIMETEWFVKLGVRTAPGNLKAMARRPRTGDSSNCRRFRGSTWASCSGRGGGERLREDGDPGDQGKELEEASGQSRAVEVHRKSTPPRVCSPSGGRPVATSLRQT